MAKWRWLRRTRSASPTPGCGAQARKDAKERAVPDYWNEFADAWLKGFDGDPIAGAAKAKPVSDQMEVEFAEAAVADPDGGTEPP